ncbi:MAG: polysaccharide biosynthesis/export family protein [Verrucomicrobiota bacterium]|nr:polysaccharide biosynthesis/export family protein [Verrucomicrobiota bacterium]
MRFQAYNFFLAASLVASPLAAQERDSSPPMMMQQPTPRPMAAEPATTSTVMRTNSMDVLDNRTRLGSNDFVSFRVVEDRDNESQRLRVNDNGQLEVPYVGLVQAAGRTSKEVAYAVKAALEKEYYYHATVIIAVDHISEKSRGKVYVIGSVRGPGPQEIPPDETYTVSKAVIRAGGFGDFADKKKVKITRKNGQSFIVNLRDVIERGRSEDDVVLMPDDQIFVPQKLINM